jgi:NAD(P)-dependent dehydrogenase (short-subunit alcohol dehydrogenase family)
MLIAKGRKALVTGAASGLGREIAARLSAAGAHVALVDLAADPVRTAAAEIGGSVSAVAADVCSTVQMRGAVEQCVEQFGGLDTLVISAGVFHVGAIESITEAQWDRTIDVNLKGAFVTIQAALSPLRASGRGRIVTIASDCGRRGFPMQAPYCASKFGLVGLTESVAAELASANVTANCICPVGVPGTGMGRQVLDWKESHTGRTREEIVQAAAQTNALGRNATEADVADAAMFLISEHASFLTGVSLDVDGGARLRGVPGV